MIKLFDFWNTLAKSKRPDSKSFHNVKKETDDPLTVSKRCFFSFLAGLLQPFLGAFQGDGPMLPYLCSSVKELVVSLLGLIVRPKVIEEAQTSALVKLVQNEKNLVETKNVHLGFAAESELQNLLKCGKVNQEQVLNLREEALVFVRTGIEKVIECNPLMSIVVRNSEAICLKVMATKSHDLLKKNVKNLIQKIVTLKLINFETGDEALTQFGKFLANEAATEKKKILNFKSAGQRLDDLYFKDFKVHENYPAFYTLLK